MEWIRDFLDTYPLTSKILWFLLLYALLYFFRKLLLNRLYQRLKGSEHWYETQKFARWTNNAILVILFLYIFGRNLSGLSTALGFAGAGITYALREVIMSIAGWFAILFGDFFTAGDRVRLGGIKGDVVDISALRTTLMEVGEWVDGDQYTGRKVRVANSYIFSSPVYNYTSSFEFLWDEITIPIPFDSNLDLARRLLIEIADKHTDKFTDQANQSWNAMRRQFKLEDASLESQVYLMLNENVIEISLRYVVDYQERREVKDKLYRDIFKAFAEHSQELEIAPSTLEVTTIKEDSDGRAL